VGQKLSPLYGALWRMNLSGYKDHQGIRSQSWTTTVMLSAAANIASFVADKSSRDSENSLRSWEKSFLSPSGC
jgi:hypothetical protein